MEWIRYEMPNGKHGWIITSQIHTDGIAMRFANLPHVSVTGGEARKRGGMKTHYRHMTPRIAGLVRELYFVGRIKQTHLARMFGIRQGSVSRIVSSLVWS